MALHLHVQPVYSQLHSDPDWIIGGVQLHTHQVETLEAFRDPVVDVLFNTAMTRDGKSLVAYLLARPQQPRILGPEDDDGEDENDEEDEDSSEEETTEEQKDPAIAATSRRDTLYAFRH